MPRRQKQTANRTDTHRAQENNVSMFYYTDIRQRTDLPHGVRHGRSGSNKRKADRPCEGISQNLILFPLIGRRAPAERKAAPEKHRWTRRAEQHKGERRDRRQRHGKRRDASFRLHHPVRSGAAYRTVFQQGLPPAPDSSGLPPLYLSERKIHYRTQLAGVLPT